MIDVSCSGRELNIEGKEIAFDYNIKEFVEHQGKIVVLLEVPSDEVDNRNVVCLNQEGEVLWRIQESPHGTQTDKPYVDLRVENGILVADNWTGVQYKVDVRTSEIQEYGFDRF